MGKVLRGLETSLVNVTIKLNAMAQPLNTVLPAQMSFFQLEFFSDFPRGASQKSGIQKVFFRPSGRFVLRQGAHGCHECLRVASSQHLVQNQ